MSKKKDISFDPIINDEDGNSYLNSDLSDEEAQKEIKELMFKARSVVAQCDDSDKAKFSILKEAQKMPKNRGLLFAFLGGDQVHEEFIKNRLYKNHILHPKNSSQ